MAAPKSVSNWIPAVECVEFTGFDHDVIDRLVRAAYANPEDVHFYGAIAALVVAHMTVTDKQGVIIMRLWFSEKVCTSSFSTRMNSFLDRCFAVNLSQWDRIKTYQHILFPHIGAIVDGTPIFVRGPSASYSGKAKAKVLVMQLFVNVAGQPIWYMGPSVGAQHDAKSFVPVANPPPHATPRAPKHHEDDIIAGDLAYIANSHVYCQYKKPPLGALTPPQTHHNEWFVTLRSTVERFNAYLDRHRLMHYCVRHWPTICKLFRVLWNSECILFYRDEKTLVDTNLIRFHTDANGYVFLRNRGPVCQCGFATHPNKTNPLQLKQLRDQLCTMLQAVPPPEKKKSKKRAKGDPAPPVAPPPEGAHPPDEEDNEEMEEEEPEQE